MFFYSLNLVTKQVEENSEVIILIAQHVHADNLYVKIFISMAVSNAMNPREDQVVPSLRRAVLGPYARLRSASLGLLRSGQT